MGISLALLAEGLAQGLGGAGHILQQQQQQAEMRQMQQQEQERQRQMDSERRMMALEQQREQQQGREQQRLMAMGEQERQRGMAGLFSRGLITAPELAAIPEGAQPADIEKLMTTLSPERRAETFGQRRQEALGQTKKPEGPSANLMARARIQAVEDYRAEYRAMNPNSDLVPPLPEEEISRRARQRLGIPEPQPEPQPELDEQGQLLESFAGSPQADTFLRSVLNAINGGGDENEIRQAIIEAIQEDRITQEQGRSLFNAVELKKGIQPQPEPKRMISDLEGEADDIQRRVWLEKALEARRKKP